MHMTFRGRGHKRRHTIVPHAATFFLLALAAAGPIAAQSDTAGNQDSTVTCRKLKAYAKRAMTDSVKAVFKRGELVVSGSGGEMKFKLPALPADDTIRTLSTTAGTCDWSVPKAAVEQMAQRQVQSTPRARVGAQFKAFTARDSAGYGIPNLEGILVDLVSAGSNAEKAGLVKGDVVVGIAGKPVKSLADLVNQTVVMSDAGDVPVDVVHQGGKRDTLKATFKVQ